MTKYKMTVRKNGFDMCLGIDEILEGTKEECLRDFYNRNAETFEELGCDDGHIVATEIDDE